MVECRRMLQNAAECCKYIGYRYIYRNSYSFLYDNY